MRKNYSPQTILWVTMVGIAATTFPITVFSASLPEVAEDLNTTESAIAWVISAPFLAVAIFTPIAGKFGDYRGHRFSYLVGFSLAIVFSFLTAAAWDVNSLIGFRTIGQAAGAFTNPATVAILLRVFPPHKQSRALGYWGAVTAMSPAVGVALGGPLIETLGWRSVFIIEGFIALAAFLTAIYVLPETPRKARTKIDFLGAVLLSGGVASLMLAINRGTEWGFDHPISILSLILTPTLLAYFVLVERKRKEPFLPMNWFKNTNFSAPIMTTFFLNASYLGAFAITPFLLDRVFEFGVSQRAAVLIIRPLLFAGGAAIGGLRHEKYGARLISVAGTGMVAIASIYMGFSSEYEILALVFVGLAFSGFGHGVVRPSLITAVGDSVNKNDLGLASGAFNTVGLMGASIGSNLMVTLIGDSADPTRFFFVYLLAAGLGILGMLSAIPITRTFTRSEDPDEDNPTDSFHPPQNE